MTEQPPIIFSRATGRLDGARTQERLAAFVMQVGAKASAVVARRGFSIGCRMLSRALDERDIVVLLGDDARFAFPFGDGYWGLLLDRSFVYEPELEQFLRSIADVDYTFIDCGANFGYWSVLVTSRPFGSHSSLAIEASRENVAKLAKNAQINGDRFKVLHCAIGASTGGQAWLSGRNHSAFSIAGDAGGGHGEKVDVTALDSVLDENRVAPGRRLVIKLDLEGAEIDAVKGGERLLQRDVMVVCEEHGSDRNHTVSRYILDETPLRLFMRDARTTRFAPVTELSMLEDLKGAPSIGYNVFASASPFWQDRIMSAGPGYFTSG
jgi:FkbM family methyltransferase